MGPGFRISSAWRSAIFQGVFFAAWMSVWNRHDYHDSWPHTIIEGAVIAVLYTLVMYFATRKQYQAGEAVLVGLTKQQRRQVLRAAKTGTPPADLTLRARAVALLEVRLANYARNRTPNLVVFSGAAVLSAVAGITSGWWYWGAVAASGYVLVSVIRYPAKHQRNLATLQPPIPNPPAKVRR